MTEYPITSGGSDDAASVAVITVSVLFHFRGKRTTYKQQQGGMQGEKARVGIEKTTNGRYHGRRRDVEGIRG